MRSRIGIFILVLISLVLAGCSMGGPTSTTAPTAAATEATPEPTAVASSEGAPGERSPDVPQLPFDDNPDPDQCGIPIAWGDDNDAWLSGMYEGELIRPTVFLYDSHLRLNITARAEHGAAVDVILYQQNPTLDYYLVKIKGAEPPNEGWVPAPFLSFETVER